MNLVMVSVLLLATLAFQPTLIYGSKGLASGAAGSHGKKHSALSSAAKAKLVMSLESGDVLVRAARGAVDGAPAAAAAAPASATAETTIGNGNSGSGTGGGGKRGKNNNNNNNKRLNKNSTPENAPTHAGRKHSDKKYSAAANEQQQQQQQQQQQHQQGTNNNKGKQRQLLKSQQHESHGKRSGSKSRAENGDKSGDGEKPRPTCRYAKSTWTECDVKTNMRTRTLSLKKGEANCPATRTMQKKCKKACRYEKGAWSECSNGQMTRQDKLKSTGSGTGTATATAIGGDSSCERVRDISKKCNPAGAAGAGKPGGKAANKERRNKDKASRRAQQHA